jgi:hypothetical protein
MTGSTLAQVLIPIVVAIALFSWLIAVLWADAHPRYKHQSTLPRYEVTGGAFQSNDGGRQLMPIPGARPVADRPGFGAPHGIPAQRSATSVPAQRSASSVAGSPGAQEAQPGEGEARRPPKPNLTAGSKIR